MQFRLCATSSRKTNTGATYDHVEWISQFDDDDATVEEAEQYVNEKMQTQRPGVIYSLRFEPIPLILH